MSTGSLRFTVSAIQVSRHHDTSLLDGCGSGVHSHPLQGLHGDLVSGDVMGLGQVSSEHQREPVLESAPRALVEVGGAVVEPHVFAQFVEDGEAGLPGAVAALVGACFAPVTHQLGHPGLGEHLERGHVVSVVGVDSGQVCL